MKGEGHPRFPCPAIQFLPGTQRTTVLPKTFPAIVLLQRLGVSRLYDKDSHLCWWGHHLSPSKTGPRTLGGGVIVCGNGYYMNWHSFPSLT